MDSRKVHPVKDRVWNEEISKAVKDCKEAWWQWRQAGEPVCADHPLSIYMKRCKRNLRKVQRKAEARRKIVQSERIMASAGTRQGILPSCKAAKEDTRLCNSLPNCRKQGLG